MPQDIKQLSDWPADSAAMLDATFIIVDATSGGLKTTSTASDPLIIGVNQGPSASGNTENVDYVPKGSGSIVVMKKGAGTLAVGAKVTNDDEGRPVTAGNNPGHGICLDAAATTEDLEVRILLIPITSS